MAAVRRGYWIAIFAAVLVAVTSGRGQVSATPPSGGQAVPEGFAAQSVDWLNAKRGWVLGAAPCGTKTCTYVVGTGDGGKTWGLFGKVLGRIAASGQVDLPGLSSIRFATPDLGWAFGSRLFATADGGHHWKAIAIPGGGKQILDLDTNAESAFAIVSPCRWVRSCDDPATVWKLSTAPGSDWEQLPLSLVVAPQFSANRAGADVAVFGDTVYVVASHSEYKPKSDRFYASTDGGEHFKPRPLPCLKKDPQGTHTLVQVVPTSPKAVTMLCVGNPGFSRANKWVFQSNDAGRTSTDAGEADRQGYTSQLAASKGGTIVIASWSDGSYIYVRPAGGETWLPGPAIGDGGLGWHDLVMVTDRVGWVVHSPLDLHDGIGRLMVTRNGGITWHRVKAVTAG